MPAIETEVKLIVPDAEAHGRLVSAAGGRGAVTVQLNIYLDTRDRRVRAAGLSLRLRVTEAGAVMTAKRRRSSASGTFVADEVEVPADRELALAWVRAGAGFEVPRHRDMAPVKRVVSGAALRPTTWSLTRRTACALPEGIEVEFDETVYPDGTRDFEVEAEHPDPELARAALDRLGRAAGVLLVPQTRSKHARARAHASRDATIPVDEVG